MSGVCEQQRRTPACASTQTDQRFCYSLFHGLIYKLATGEVSIFQLVSEAKETGLSLALWGTPELGEARFCHDEAHIIYSKCAGSEQMLDLY